MLKFANSQHYPPAPFARFIGSLMRALIAETAVWPNFFFMNVFFALKGSKLFYYYFLSLQLDVVPCGGRKKSPRTHL